MKSSCQERANTSNAEYAMTFTKMLSMLSVVLFALSGGAALAADQKLPMRKAGLWEMKTVMDEGNGPKDQTMKMCIDGDMERNTVDASLDEHKKTCKQYDVKVDGGKTVVDADCTFSTRRVVSTTTMSGDFSTAFEISIASTTTSVEEKDQSVVVKRTITQNGKYVGESCGELKAGEAEGTDGSRIMVQ